jgi:hypothetical protein
MLNTTRDHIKRLSASEVITLALSLRAVVVARSVEYVEYERSFLRDAQRFSLFSQLFFSVFPDAWGGRVLHPSSLGQEAAEEAQALRMELLRQEIIPEFGSEIWRRCS